MGEPTVVPDIAEEEVDRDIPAQPKCHVVKATLVGVKQHEQAGMEFRHLTAELAPDGACGAGDQHSSAPNIASRRGLAEIDRVARQEIVDADRPELTANGGIDPERFERRNPVLHSFPKDTT